HLITVGTDYAAFIGITQSLIDHITSFRRCDHSTHATVFSLFFFPLFRSCSPLARLLLVIACYFSFLSAVSSCLIPSRLVSLDLAPPCSSTAARSGLQEGHIFLSLPHTILPHFTSRARHSFHYMHCMVDVEGLLFCSIFAYIYQM
ncbi:hypothetical protein RSAG8_05026, partial [Rhizoctonia solani AG-8 WAC10335]